MISAIKFMVSPIGRGLAFVGAALVFVAVIFARGRKAGVQSEQARQQEIVNQAEEQFDAIDDERPDFDSAIDRLRDRSKGGRR
jgi:hypothetical protein